MGRPSTPQRGRRPTRRRGRPATTLGAVGARRQRLGVCGRGASAGRPEQPRRGRPPVPARPAVRTSAQWAFSSGRQLLVGATHSSRAVGRPLAHRRGGPARQPRRGDGTRRGEAGRRGRQADADADAETGRPSAASARCAAHPMPAGASSARREQAGSASSVRLEQLFRGSPQRADADAETTTGPAPLAPRRGGPSHRAGACVRPMPMPTTGPAP